MIKTAIIFIFFSIIACEKKHSNKQDYPIEIANLDLSGTISDDTSKIWNIIPIEDSIQVEKVERKIRQTKWFKEVLSNSQKVSMMILPPDKVDSSHYWFKVGDNRPDRFVTFRQYATKKGEWKLLYYDSTEGNLVSVKE